jgi:hypothetical protein
MHLIASQVSKLAQLLIKSCLGFLWFVFSKQIIVYLKTIRGQPNCSYFCLPPGKVNLIVLDLCQVLVAGFLSWNVFLNAKNFLQVPKCL